MYGSHLEAGHIVGGERLLVREPNEARKAGEGLDETDEVDDLLGVTSQNLVSDEILEGGDGRA